MRTLTGYWILPRRLVAAARRACAVWIGSALSLAVFAGGAGCARTDTLEGLEKKLVRLWESNRTFTAKVKVSSDIQSGDGMARTEFVSNYAYMHKNGKTMVRQEGKSTGVEMKQDGRSRKIEQTSLTVADGDMVYTFGDGMGIANVYKMTQGTTQDTLGGPILFSTLKHDYTLELLPPTTTDGQEVYVIQGIVRGGGVGLAEKVIYHFSAATGIAIHVETHTNDGKSHIVMTVSDLKINVPLSPDRFTFQPPPDVRVVDMDAFNRSLEAQKKLGGPQKPIQPGGESTSTPSAPTIEPVPGESPKGLEDH